MFEPWIRVLEFVGNIFGGALATSFGAAGSLAQHTAEGATQVMQDSAKEGEKAAGPFGGVLGGTYGFMLGSVLGAWRGTGVLAGFGVVEPPVRKAIKPAAKKRAPTPAKKASRTRK